MCIRVWSFPSAARFVMLANRMVVLSAALVFSLTVISPSLAVIVPSSSEARLIDDPSDARDQDNGGDTTDGRLIGVNTGGIDNFMVFGIDDFSAAAGLTVSGATVEVFLPPGFDHPQRGSDLDFIHLNVLALPNAGFVAGSTNKIAGTTNFTNDGTISYANRVQYLTGGTSESLTMPWLDASGVGVNNIEEAMTQIGTVAGHTADALPESGSVVFSVDAATAQGWLDVGLAGLVLSATDDGDGRSRFNFAPGGSFDRTVEIDFIDPNATPAIDFDSSGVVDCLDVDALVNEVTAGTNNAAFDLNGDGLVEGQDLTDWLAAAGAVNLASGNSFIVGDVSLDGSVDSVDLGQLLNNFSAENGTAAYCGGDLDADGSVNSVDLGLLLNNFNASANSAVVTQVPEPNTLPLVALAMILLISSVRNCHLRGRLP